MRPLHGAAPLTVRSFTVQQRGEGRTAHNVIVKRF